MIEPKLDVDTLEYIRDCLMIEVDFHKEESEMYAKRGDYYDADRSDNKRSALQHFKEIVEHLIKQREV